MKILVCFKVLPNPDGILEEDFENFSSADLSYAGYEINCFDSSALEMGLKLKEQLAVTGGNSTCTALSVSNRLSPKTIQTLYSVDFDEVIKIPLKNREFKPKEIARAISDYALEIKADIILTGSNCGYLESGSVPYYIAENLGYPVVSGVEKAEIKDSLIEVTGRSEGVKRLTLLNAPVVISVDNSPEVLRFSSLKKMLLCRSKVPTEYIPENLDEALIEPTIYRPKSSRTCKLLEETEAFNEIKRTLDEALNSASKKEKTKKADSNKSFNEGIYINSTCNYGEDYKEIKEFLVKNPKKLILLPNNNEGKILAVKLSKELNINTFFGGEIEDIKKDKITISKRIYASNLILKEEFSYPLIATVKNSEKYLKNISTFESNEAHTLPSFIVDEKTEGEEKADLDKEFIFACGVGMGSKENCQKVRNLAKKLGAGFGLTRPAALNEWGSINEIIGQSGSIIKPKCVVTLGVSGAGAFVLGVENAEKIIAVNTDSNALIFKNADYGINMDAVKFIENLSELY